MTMVAPESGSSRESEPKRSAPAAAKVETLPALSFRDAFLIELGAVAERRAAFAGGHLAMAKREPDETPALKVERGPAEQVRPIDETELALVGGWRGTDRDVRFRLNVNSPAERLSYTEGDPIKDADALNLTGMCLSGGGIRSAAVSLGVFQAIDSLTPAGDAGVINRLDYVSAVSGGNHMATSVVAGMLQPRPDGGAAWPPSFPYESKTDGSETPETQHLRNYSSFLVPFGAVDYVANILVVLRGLFANALMIAPAILFASALFLLFRPTTGALLAPVGLDWAPLSALKPFWQAWLGPFLFAPILALVLVVVLLAPVLAERRSASPPTLVSSERRSRLIATLAFMALGAAAIEIQPSVIAAMLAGSTPSTDTSDLAKAIGAVFRWFGEAGAFLGPLALSLALFAQKFVSLAKATVSAETWTAVSTRAIAIAGLALLGLSVPLALYALWLNLTLWGLDAGRLAPTHLKAVADTTARLSPALAAALGGPVALLWFLLGLASLLLALLITPNGNSLHRLYRDRLSRAFLLERLELWEKAQGVPQERRSAVAGDANGWTFGSLKERGAPTDPFRRQAAAPYLLVNTAVNLQSRYLDLRGRKADVFTLGPLTCGSHATRYARTSDLEQRDANLSLAAGMAISGAAASANMGGRTIPILTFSLAALNIRLGYWLPNPQRLMQLPKEHKPEKRLNSGSGLVWFWRELFGAITSTTPRIHLTDGGHVENLGIYELLKRRCRVIVAVDAEEDQGLVFASLVKAQLMARVDYGVRIQLPWPEIARAGKASAKSPTEGEVKAEAGPHVTVGRIIYREKDPNDPASQDVHGVLIYVKSSITGDENDLVRDYRRRHPSFPHETTMNQFFTEEQFEAYRALGFHMGRGFFTGADDAAFHDPGAAGRAAFLADVRAALTSLGVPADQVDAIVARGGQVYEKKDRNRRDAEALARAPREDERARRLLRAAFGIRSRGRR